MPVRIIDVNKLESCEDLPEEPRKKKSMVLSFIGIILLLVDIVGMAYFSIQYGSMHNRPKNIQLISKGLEIGCIGSVVLLFVAFKFNRKNKPFLVFLGLWIAYIVWFMVAMSTGIPFF